MGRVLAEHLVVLAVLAFLEAVEIVQKLANLERCKDLSPGGIVRLAPFRNFGRLAIKVTPEVDDLHHVAQSSCSDLVVATRELPVCRCQVVEDPSAEQLHRLQIEVAGAVPFREIVDVVHDSFDELDMIE